MAIGKEIIELFDLTGKTAVVAGGAKGIGEGIMKRLAEAGANVLSCDFNEEGLQVAVKRLTDRGLKVTGIYCDLQKEEDCNNVMHKAVEIYGGLDFLVYSAGIYPIVPLSEVTDELYQKVFNTNVRGAHFMCREAMKIMMAQNETTPGRGGSIVLISSHGSQRASLIGQTTYHSSKGALVSLKNDAAAELAPYDIRINCVLPAGVGTFPDENGNYPLMPMKRDANPLGRLAVPDDIANAVLFFLSPAASMVTGAELFVDTGTFRAPLYGYDYKVTL
jgi:NAD(P)-dependent dehydrogenase (short-subunit alcohol dehydrogenase family)